VEKISIVIPVFNEQDCIEKTIQETDRLFQVSGFEFNIVIINDGSTDKTDEILEGITNPSFRVIRHETNRGYGAALKTGIINSSSEYVCIIDADGTYPINEIPRLAQFLEEGYSMVVGSRTGKKARAPFSRFFAKWLLTKLANYLTGFKVPDMNSGLRIMRKADVERFFNILPDGFSFTTTITLAMLTNNMRVHYMPIDYYQREGRSKIRPFYDTINFLQLIIRTSVYFNPLKVFIPLSVSLVIFAFLVLLASWIILGKAMDVTFGVIIMSAVIVMAIGMLADLIDKRLP
jgi:glycosyltransferase involved in cell wall biosynthesis